MPKTKNAVRALKHSRRAAWRKVADEAVILDVDTAHYFSLRGCGLRAWELLGAPLTPAALTERLRAEYEGATLDRDVAELLKSLRAAGLIEPV